MELPFFRDQFLEVFRNYNEAIWPSQLFGYVLGLACLAAILWRPARYARFVFAALAVFWLWNGLAYHLAFFRTINPAAIAFASLFVLQAVLFGGYALRVRDVGSGSGFGRALGWLAAAYALVVYPLIGQALGHAWPASPVFGVAPCPTVIFTFAVLLMLGARRFWPLLVVPVLWAIVGTSAAATLGMTEDLGLTLSALVAVVVAVSEARVSRPQLPGKPALSR